jgi:hypothetical protein
LNCHGFGALLAPEPAAKAEIPNPNTAVKAEIPNPKFQAPNKSQALKFQKAEWSARLCFGNWDLKIPWSLDLGIWSLQRDALALELPPQRVGAPGSNETRRRR